ncbi:hypothetical protein [Archangium violaceum]|uniref:hypothetical protein n=1 Tax=Archangium violaceum TaxID=83451 RepID=UPI0013631F1E|nr:hypothetical protein [Archangium violaceum]
MRAEVPAKGLRDFFPRHAADDCSALLLILCFQQRVKGRAQLWSQEIAAAPIPEEVWEVDLERLQPGVLEGPDLRKELNRPLLAVRPDGVDVKRLREGLVGLTRRFHGGASPCPRVRSREASNTWLCCMSTRNHPTYYVTLDKATVGVVYPLP